jgi:hypothetical protein
MDFKHKRKKFTVYKNPIIWQSSKYFANITAAVLLTLLYSHRIFQLLRMLLAKEEVPRRNWDGCTGFVCLLLRRADGRFRWRVASSSLGLIGLRVYTCLNHVSPHRLPYSLLLYFYPFNLISFFYSRKLRRDLIELNMRRALISNLLPLLRKIVLHWERQEDNKQKSWTIIPFWKAVRYLITCDLLSTKPRKSQITRIHCTNNGNRLTHNRAIFHRIRSFTIVFTSMYNWTLSWGKQWT